MIHNEIQCELEYEIQHDTVSDLLPIDSLVVVGDQAYHCCVCKLNDGVGVVPGHAVVGEKGVQEGTEHTPLRGSGVEDQRGKCVVQDPVVEGGV